MKRFKGFNPMLFAAAVIFLCVTVYSLVSNVTVYVRQRNWPVATATVIDVAENGKEYNITYQYEARGNVYTGKLHRVCACATALGRPWPSGMTPTRRRSPSGRGP